MYFSRGPKTHFSLPYYIYYIYIISHLIREKSGKVGHDAHKRWYYHVFAGPVLKIKVGHGPKKSGPKYFSVRTNSSMAQIKVAQTHFQISINGPKRKGVVSPDNQSSSIFSAKVLALYKYSSSSQLSNILSNPLIPAFAFSIISTTSSVI